MSEPKDNHIQNAAHVLNVLLVEDDDINQQVAKSMLEKRGHRMTIVTNGQQALEAIALHRYDVILMDIQLPGMSGIEVTRHIRAQEQGREHQRIIATTAHGRQEDRLRYQQAGMDGHLSKPFRPEELYQVVENPLDTSPTCGSEMIFDEEEFVERMQGDIELISELIGIFRQTAPDLLQALREAIQLEDTEELCKAAHRLRGAAGTIGASIVQREAHSLELIGKKGHLAEARVKLPCLEQMFEELWPALDALETKGR